MIRFLGDGPLEFTDELVRTASGQYDLSLVQHLCLASLSLRSIDRPVLCSQLVCISTLDVSKNSLTSLDGIAPLARTLVRLDASFNSISTVSALLGSSGDAFFGRLEVLRLQGNALQSLETVLPLAKALPKLRAIYLRDQNLKNSNPVCDADLGYATAMAKAFVPKCRCIDGHYFCHEDVKPRRLDDGDDNELALPPSKPWVTDAFFAAAVTENAGELFGRASEAECKRLVKETRTMLEERKGVNTFQ
jgi:hypothetical protein